jgi:hypothetical protein
MLGVIETLLDDGVIIFEEDLRRIEALFKAYPDIITDVIKVHEFARMNKEIVIIEYIYPTKNNTLIYELATYSVNEAVGLTLKVGKLGVKSKNLSVGVVYFNDTVGEMIDEGD